MYVKGLINIDDGGEGYYIIKTPGDKTDNILVFNGIEWEFYRIHLGTIPFELSRSVFDGTPNDTSDNTDWNI